MIELQEVDDSTVIVGNFTTPHQNGHVQQAENQKGHNLIHHQWAGYNAYQQQQNTHFSQTHMEPK